MSRTKAKAQIALNKKNDAILKKHVEQAKAEREASEDLNRHKKMIGKTVFVMQDNLICDGKVVEVRVNVTEDKKTIHYLIEDPKHKANVYKFFHKDCFKSIADLFKDLKQSYAEYKDSNPEALIAADK